MICPTVECCCCWRLSMCLKTLVSHPLSYSHHLLGKQTGKSSMLWQDNILPNVTFQVQTLFVVLLRNILISSLTPQARLCVQGTRSLRPTKLSIPKLQDQWKKPSSRRSVTIPCLLFLLFFSFSKINEQFYFHFPAGRGEMTTPNFPAPPTQAERKSLKLQILGSHTFAGSVAHLATHLLYLHP